MSGFANTSIIIFALSASMDSSETEFFQLFETNGPFLQLAVDLDCYFTIEEYGDSLPLRRNQQKIYRQPLSLSRKGYSDLDDFVADLNSKLKGAKAYRDIASSRIIRIVNTKLLEERTYVLNQKQSLNFQGTIYELLGDFERSTGVLSGAKGGTFGTGVIHGDPDRRISIQARGENLRTIMTSYLPLSQYSRLLWTTETNADFSKTWIRYKGKAPEFFFWPAMRAKEMCDFSKGETAYYANKARFEAGQAARDFVEQRLREKTKDPLQVRWAMLLLGEQKDKVAIPLLIRHIDYLYTPTGLVEESYPAVKALTAIGEASVERVMNELGMAQSDLRIKLLGKVIFNVLGTQEANNVFDRRFRHALDPTIKARFEKARDFWK